LARGAEQVTPNRPPYQRFDPEALEAFTEWRRGFEAELRTGKMYPALKSHFAKYRKLVPALALAFHLADGQRGPEGPGGVKKEERGGSRDIWRLGRRTCISEERAQEAFGLFATHEVQVF
jgi:hypothetical protein